MKLCVVLVVAGLGLLAAVSCQIEDEDCVEGEEGCDPTRTPGHTSGGPVADSQDNILILTDENFAEIVKKEEMIMTTFYAPWYLFYNDSLPPDMILP